MTANQRTYCPVCRDTKGSTVIDSRVLPLFGYELVRRRRECLSCHDRYNTFELPEQLLHDGVMNVATINNIIALLRVLRDDAEKDFGNDQPLTIKG